MTSVLSRRCYRSFSHDEALARVRALVPEISRRAATAESLRRLPDETLADLHTSGLFGLATPRRWGGSELGPETWVEVIAELAAGCGSTGWVYGVLLGHTWLVSLFAERAQTEVFGQPDALVASLVRLGGSDPERVAGGFRWRDGVGRFCSGVDFAQWVLVGGTVPPAQPRWFLIPARDVTIEDDWFTAGLRGTGSKTIRLHDAFIPEHRSVLQADVNSGDAPGLQVNPGELYRLPGNTWTFVLPATPIGIARGAVHLVKPMLARRFESMVDEQVAEQSATLATFGAAATNIEAAYTMLMARARRLMATSERPYSTLERRRFRQTAVDRAHRDKSVRISRRGVEHVAVVVPVRTGVLHQHGLVHSSQGHALRQLLGID
jgi:alkylation response protein AidB-like acyl-CoA dehydrogenase